MFIMDSNLKMVLKIEKNDISLDDHILKCEHIPSSNNELLDWIDESKLDYRFLSGNPFSKTILQNNTDKIN